MAMEDVENNSAVVATSTQAGIKKGGDVGDNGACIDRQPDTVVHQAGLNQTAGRGSRSGPGAHAATGIRVLKRNMKRNGSRGCVTRKNRFGSRERDWLKGDTQRGCVCLYGGTVDPQPPASGPQASSTPQTDLKLVLCSTTTTVEELCAQRDGQGLYVQLHGDLVRRLDPTERPLQMVYDYLAAMGYADPVRVQQEAANSDLSCLIRFYSGPYHPLLTPCTAVSLICSSSDGTPKDQPLLLISQPANLLSGALGLFIICFLGEGKNTSSLHFIWMPL